MMTTKRSWIAQAWAAVVALFSPRLPKVPDGFTRMFMYGSLKPGFYNFDRGFFIDGEAQVFGKVARVIAEDIVNGLTLVSLGSYPGAIFGSGNRDESFITGYVMDVPNGMAARIEDMERGAGYDGVRLKTANGYDVLVWVFQNQYGRKLDLIGPTWTEDHQNGRARGRGRSA
jgi:gamma-glutamylcyclotransferase (GGCT)/AIG2-like uncharacterized protein YtfP